MAIVRINKNKDYVTMSNYHFKEKDMSLKAKGLLSEMLSLPDDWDYSIAGLVAINKENETSIKSTLDELRQFGYLKITKLLPNETKTGRIEYVYDIYEQKQEGEKQGVENLGVEFLGLENQGQYNINNKELKINNKLNEFNLYNNYSEHLQCECYTKSTKEKCLRRSCFNINGKNYCNQHAKYLIPNLKINNEDVKMEFLQQEFDKLWEIYPKKQGKKDALRHYIKARKSGIEYQDVLKGLQNYINYINITNKENKYVKQASTWFNQECWNDEYDIKENKGNEIIPEWFGKEYKKDEYEFSEEDKRRFGIG